MDNIKQICARLIELWDADCDINIEINELRAALAEPEPEGPTDEEIMDLMPQQMRDDFAAAARVMSSFHPDIDKTDSVFRMILNRHSVDYARAVLARWGK